MRKKIICLMGPTASGKTELALALARECNGEIISVDSAVVYKTMDIGTATPPEQLQAEIPHHLVNMIDPKKSYSAADFCRDAVIAIEDILARGKLPILVGGTMLYFRAFLFGLSPLPSADPQIRQDIENEAAQYGWQYMHQQLMKVDPNSAANIHENDPQRIQRALEVYRISGQPLSELQQHKSAAAMQYSALQLAIVPANRQCLHQRIASRFTDMLADGLLEEVTNLYQRGDLHIDLPAMRSVGYRQIWQYLNGEIDEQRMYDKAVASTRQLAKRQLTWLRSWPELQLFDMEDPNLAAKLIKIVDAYLLND